MYLSFIQCPLSFFTYANNFFTSCCLYWESIFCLVNKKCENELAHGHGTLNPRNDNKVVCINSRLGLSSKSIEFYREKIALVEEERLWQAGGWQNYTYGVNKKVYILPPQENKTLINVTVKDQGIGIDKEDQ